MTISRRLSQVATLVVSLGAVLALSGCGGGGTDTPVDVPSAQATISGSVVKGPVSGATVQAYAVAGGAVGQAIATATTDAQGAFTMSLPSQSGPLILRTSGGTYMDEATGALMTVAAGDMMTVALSSVAAGSTVNGVQVTPLTSMAQAMAEQMAGGLTAANVMSANAAVGRYFMVDDIVLTHPMNPLVPGSGATATQAAKNYGVALAAMSEYAKSHGMPVSSAAVTALMRDASDGVMDGRAGSGLIVMGGMMSGGMMQPSAGSTELASAMMDFVASSLNKSGLTAEDIALLQQQLETCNGRIQ